MPYLTKCLRKFVFGVTLLGLSLSTYAQLNLPISSEGAILLEANTGTILYSKNKDSRFYPASTTKVLTCALLLNEINPTDILAKTADSIQNVPSDSSHCGLRVGENYSALDGIYSIMMASDNFVAYDMAVYDAGSVAAFADKMNTAAQKIGATNSHFVNPHGYHDNDHYTTPYDLGLITRWAFNNPALTEIAGTYRHTLEVIENREITLTHTSALVNPDSEYFNPAVVASKTGYHTPAGRVLVAKASYPNIELIGVVMKTTSPNQFIDMNTLFEYGSSYFSTVTDATGQTGLANLSFSDWGKPYVLKALELGYITASAKHYQSSISPYDFVILLLKALPYEYRSSCLNYLGNYPYSIFNQKGTLTHEEALTIIESLGQDLGFSYQSVLSHKQVIAPDTLAFTLTYEEAIALTCQVKVLVETALPNLILSANFY